MPKSYFPPQSLKDATLISETIYRRNSGNPMFRVSLAEDLDLPSEGTKFRNLITASSGYGLTSGSYKAEKIELQPRGEDLAKGNIEAAFEALFSIEVFQRFYDYFGTGGAKSVPSEKAAKDFLEKECGIPSRQVSNALDNILNNARDWSLLQNIAGGEKFVPIELAKQTFTTSSSKTKPDLVTPSTPQISQQQVKSQANTSQPATEVSPSLQLNIEIHIAGDTSDEKIETIFKNMKKYLLSK